MGNRVASRAALSAAARLFAAASDPPAESVTPHWGQSVTGARSRRVIWYSAVAFDKLITIQSCRRDGVADILVTLSGYVLHVVCANVAELV